jgi:hypothetical protein
LQSGYKRVELSSREKVRKKTPFSAANLAEGKKRLVEQSHVLGPENTVTIALGGI